MLLPTAILVLAGVAIVIRHVRASVAEVLGCALRAGRPCVSASGRLDCFSGMCCR